MKTINLSPLPPGSKICGELLEDYSKCPGRLSQDILQVILATGETIDVGWTPVFDTNGTFQIHVFADDWDNQIEEAKEASTPYAAVTKIREIAFRLFRLTSPKYVKNSKDLIIPPYFFGPSHVKVAMASI